MVSKQITETIYTVVEIPILPLIVSLPGYTILFTNISYSAAGPFMFMNQVEFSFYFREKKWLEFDSFSLFLIEEPVYGYDLYLSHSENMIENLCNNSRSHTCDIRALLRLVEIQNSS